MPHDTRIDIDRLSEPELIDLNRRIVERLRMVQTLRSRQQMMNSRSASACASSRRGRACWRAS